MLVVGMVLQNHLLECQLGGNMSIPKGELKQKCSYYNGRMKCAFFGQGKCIYDKGMVPFPYDCGVECYMEEQATREP